MDEAQKILREVVDKYRHLSYKDLARWVSNKRVEVIEHDSPDGKTYQIELQAMWDDKKSGDIRFWGSIDPPHTRWWHRIIQPTINYSFIMRRDGSFVDESKDSRG